MEKRDHDMPEANRTPSEIEFVLRNAKRKTGPEVLRDIARAEAKPEPARKVDAAPRRGKTLF